MTPDGIFPNEKTLVKEIDRALKMIKAEEENKPAT